MDQILTEELQKLSKEIVDIAYKVHKSLGPGLLESIYETCFCYELTKRKIPFKRQQYVDILYDGSLLVHNALRVDILVDNKIIVELKSQEISIPVWNAQILSQLKLTNKKLGFLINFDVPLIKHGIKGIIL
jgi:GxxExxY protein